jgi:hypothetical protein
VPGTRATVSISPFPQKHRGISSFFMATHPWSAGDTLVYGLDRDVRHYNKHFNPGDALQIDFNLSPDVEEKRHSGEYTDAPPDDDDDDD